MSHCHRACAGCVGASCPAAKFASLGKVPLTYPRDSDKPVTARSARCNGCGKYQPIVMVIDGRKYCEACGQVIWDKWQARGGSACTIKATDDGPVFELSDDGSNG